VVAFGYCDESKHMYKLGKSSSPLAQNKFVAVGAIVNDDSMLWQYFLGIQFMDA
jgi:hypothetical protein